MFCILNDPWGILERRQIARFRSSLSIAVVNMDVHNHGLLLSPFSNSTKILYRIHCSLQTKVKGPPKNYTLKDAAYKESLEIVASQFPQLCDLVENGPSFSQFFLQGLQQGR